MSEAVVELSGVQVDLGGSRVLENLDLAVGRNDFLGVIGPNGGGKTTLLRVILGMVTPTDGSVSVFGTDPAHARKRVGYVPQQTFFDRGFPISVLDTVLLGFLQRRPPLRRFTRADRRSAAEALDRVGLAHLAGRRLGALSGGELQRAFIARALVGRPQLLLLDEPTSSVDQTSKTSVYELLHQLRSELAIILVTHDVGVISNHVDSIACLNRRLFLHNDKTISSETLRKVYGCPVDLIAHGVPHRVLDVHTGEEDT
jgi:zinc transport system ATP-binding protein